MQRSVNIDVDKKWIREDKVIDKEWIRGEAAVLKKQQKIVRTT